MRTFCLGLLVLTISNAASGSTLRTYFNSNASHRYTDSYRNIERPGDDFEAILLEEIASAKTRLWIAVQELRVPSIARALVEKKAAGVDVRLILENTYNFDFSKLKVGDKGYSGQRMLDYFLFTDMNRNGRLEKAELAERDAITILRTAGVATLDDTADGTVGSGLMHHKFLIIDDHRVVVTSANFTLSDTHGDFGKPNTRGNANALLVVDNADMNAHFAEEFGYLWGDGPGKKKNSLFGTRKPYRAPKTFDVGDGERVTVQFSATKARTDVDSTTDLISRAVGSAKHAIRFALFAFSDQRIVNAMATAHEHGATVEGLVEPSFAYRPYSELLDMWGIEVMGEQCRPEPGNAPWDDAIETVGVPDLPDGDFLHHKFATVDGERVVFGSHNWSESAAHTNDETLLVVDSTAVTAAFDAEMDRLLAGGKLGAPKWLRDQARNGDCVSSTAPISQDF